MNSKARLRPGDLRIIGGMIAALGGAIWLGIVLSVDLPFYSELQSEGRSVEARIVAKQVQSDTGGLRKRSTRSDKYFFDVAFDPASSVPFGADLPTRTTPSQPAKPRTGADIVAGLAIGSGAPAPAASGPQQRTRVQVGSHARFEAYRTGDAIGISYLPADPAKAKLTEVARSQNPWLNLAGSATLLLAGLMLGLNGWRRRRAIV